MTWLVKLFPPEWKARYGDEFEALLEQQRLSPGDLVNIVFAALGAWRHRIDAQALRFDDRSPTAPKAESQSGGIAMVLAAGLAFLVTWVASVPPAYGADRTLYNFVLLLIPFIPLLVNAGIARSCLSARRHGRSNLVLAMAVVGTSLGTGLLVIAFAARLLGGAEDVLTTVGYFGGFQLLLAGNAFYSAGMWRAGLLWYWSAIPLLLTTVAGITVLNVLQLDHYLFVTWMHGIEWILGSALAGSWFLVGLILLHSEKAPYSAAHS